MSSTTISSRSTTSSFTSSAREHDVKTLDQRFVDEVINGRDLGAALTELVAEDFVEENPLPGQGPGRAGLADVLGGMFAAFPDLAWTVHRLIAEGDQVASYCTWTGTHRGDFMGIPATSRPVTVEAWTMDRFRHGQLVQSRIIMDVAGLLGQLGVLPGPSSK
jgi:steroid delta-isomerase-like uncharacterized protein